MPCVDDHLWVSNFKPASLARNSYVAASTGSLSTMQSSCVDMKELRDMQQTTCSSTYNNSSRYH